MISLRRAREVFVRHLAFVGPGLVSAVAYIDPGNWATDLEGGARFGYKLLFIIFLAGLAAVVLQILSVRLGAVTSQSLPAQTRALFLRWEAQYPKYKRLLRAGLYTLWALAEIAIIATDLAELLGSAIALHLLFPKLPLFAGVLITAADVMIVLVFFRTSNGRNGMMFFEIIIVVMVLAVFVSFMILLHLIKPEWREVFLGLVPSKTLVKPGALYIGVGIIGATVMPHALFLGSALASVDRLNMLPKPPTRRRKMFKNAKMPSFNPLAAMRGRRNGNTEAEAQAQAIEMDERALDLEIELPNEPMPAHSSRSRLDLPQMENGVGLQLAPKSSKEDDFEAAMEEYEAELRRFDRIRWVDLHVKHATVDTGYSLLGFALTINSSILTLAGAAFYYGAGDPENADLAGAHALIKDYIGTGAAIIFALALLCAGQSASITATLAGQIVSEGFLEWKTSPLVRRLCTRLIGVIPAAAVAAAVGNKGLDDMLVASQVVLSIVLPTVIAPLVYLCSRADVMKVQGPIDEVRAPTPSTPTPAPTPEAETETAVVRASGTDSRPTGAATPVSATSVPVPAETVPERRSKSYVSPKWVTILGWALNTVVIVANVYVIVELAMGRG